MGEDDTRRLERVLRSRVEMVTKTLEIPKFLEILEGLSSILSEKECQAIKEAENDKKVEILISTVLDLCATNLEVLPKFKNLLEQHDQELYGKLLAEDDVVASAATELSGQSEEQHDQELYGKLLPEDDVIDSAATELSGQSEKQHDQDLNGKLLAEDDVVDSAAAELSGQSEGLVLGNEELSSEPMELEPEETEDGGKAEPQEECTGPFYWPYAFDEVVKSLCFATADQKELATSEFLKGCKWAPDGSCLLTNSDDSRVRVFNFPENVSQVQDWKDVTADSIDEDITWRSALFIKEGGLIYDYCWYPYLSSLDPATTVFLTTSKDTPIHLWDATYGHLRATYLGYNDVDEPTAAFSVAFDSSGEKIFAGYDKHIRIFNMARPGRQCVIRKLKTSPLPDLNQHGLISCFAFNPAWSNVYACGSYKSTIGLYMEDGTVISVLEGHTGGLTQLLFSRDGTKLYSGARSDPKLFCWDLRNMGSEYKVYNRVVKTQQRIYFELTTDDRYLISGGTDGIVRLWDTSKEDCNEFQAINVDTDCVNGVSINPYVPVLATASGQRKLDNITEDSDDDSEADIIVAVPKKEKFCQLKLWKL